MRPAHVEVHFRRLRHSGSTLAIVMAGSEVYSALDVSPLNALRAAARKASKLTHWLGLGENDIVQRGETGASWITDERRHDSRGRSRA